jgi:hypothetical protein
VPSRAVRNLRFWHSGDEVRPGRRVTSSIAVFLGLVARQRYQPGFGLRRDRWFLARRRSIIECRQRAIGQRPLDAALYRLMMDPKSPAHCAERRMLTISQQDLRPRYTARRFGSRPRKSPQCCNLFIAHRQFDRLPSSRHPAMMPLLVSPIANKESTNNPPVLWLQASWNQSSRHLGRAWWMLAGK